MALDKEAVAHIAALARIRLGEPELEPLAAELSHILDWVEQLGEVDTSDVAPMTSVAATLLPMREDVVTDGDCQGAILANAPQSAPDGSNRGGPQRGFFAVPKVVE
jgi:aspartyl-tRNA(Asn)/glutamyl-tRNA(Gln) amidotransferase subunit C